MEKEEECRGYQAEVNKLEEQLRKLQNNKATNSNKFICNIQKQVEVCIKQKNEMENVKCFEIDPKTVDLPLSLNQQAKTAPLKAVSQK
jgi:phage replication-related protein YjqB (UPF0714/DUF867 family)